MDPNANLKEQGELARAILLIRDREGTLDEDDVDRLAELVLALDEWIRKGGSLPTEWRVTDE